MKGNTSLDATLPMLNIARVIAGFNSVPVIFAPRISRIAKIPDDAYTFPPVAMMTYANANVAKYSNRYAFIVIDYIVYV